MDRYNATKKIREALLTIDGRTSPLDYEYPFNCSVYNVYEGYRFLDEINEFPSLMLVCEKEEIRHVGGGVRYSLVNYELRGLHWSEETQFAGELLAEDIEHVLQNSRVWAPEFEELRVLDIQTDDGLYAPLGSVIIRFTVLFER